MQFDWAIASERRYTISFMVFFAFITIEPFVAALFTATCDCLLSVAGELGVFWSTGATRYRLRRFFVRN